MDNKQTWLSRTECAALRGFAILAIILHNYCHWLRLAVKENEYTFTAGKASGFWHHLCQPDLYLPVQAVSFLGHYGVPLFLFLSGYGLVMKYEREKDLPRWGFIRYHYQKLFNMMILGFAAFTMVDAITLGSFHYRAEHIVAQLLMYINVLPHPNAIIWPGPYWFFGLMLQLYLLYRFCFHRRHWSVIVAVIALCWVMQAIQEPQSELLNRLRYNSIGGVLPFGAGLLLARLTLQERMQSFAAWHRWQWALLAAVSLGLIVAGSMTYATWYMVPLLVIVCGVASVKSLPLHRFQWLVWVGNISAALFVTHPILRKIFIPMSHRGEVYGGLLLYLISALIVAWLCQQLINRMPKAHM